MCRAFAILLFLVFRIFYAAVKATDFSARNITAVTDGLHIRMQGKPVVIGIAQ